MRLIDTHCHIDLFQDFERVVEEIERRQIYTIAVTNAPSVYSQSSKLGDGSKFIRTALGLHPELAATHERELALFKMLLPQTKYVGEVGLDYSTTDYRDRGAQRRVFEEVIGHCREAGSKVVTIHSRKAENDVIAAIGSNFPGVIILHWYTGSTRALTKAVDAGFYFSINPAMIRSRSGQHLIQSIPLDRILTESDGPFVSVGGRSARPTDVPTVVSQLGNLLEKDPEIMSQIVFENFLRVLKYEVPAGR